MKYIQKLSLKINFKILRLFRLARQKQINICNSDLTFKYFINFNRKFFNIFLLKKIC